MVCCVVSSQDFLDAVAAHPLLRYDLEYLQFINPREFSEDFESKRCTHVQSLYHLTIVSTIPPSSHRCKYNPSVFSPL